MRLKTKLPISLQGIADLMEMNREEIRAWPHVREVRELFKDYNFGALPKENLISKLYNVSLKCANEKIYHYSTGIDNAVSAIKLFY